MENKLEFKGTIGWEESSIAHYMRHEDGSTAEVVTVYDGDENPVCYVSFENQTQEEGNAHLKIIKTAPELLQALQDTLFGLELANKENPNEGFKKSIELAKQAIQKALG